MAIITFWNESEKENGQTLSMLAIVNQMAVEHNYRILMIDACLEDKTLEYAFWRNKDAKLFKDLNIKNVDISSGAEGLISAVSSNKITPEIITNYTKIVYKNRLDVLLALKTKVLEEHENALLLYKDLITAANKYYDFVFVDLPKGLKRESTKILLKQSNLIIYTMPPNLINIDNFMDLKKDNSTFGSRRVLPLLSKSDENSSYNVKNTTRYIKEKGIIPCIPYNVRFMEAVNESRTTKFFTAQKLSSSKNKEPFFKEVEKTCEIIINRLKELNM